MEFLRPLNIKLPTCIEMLLHFLPVPAHSLLKYVCAIHGIAVHKLRLITNRAGAGENHLVHDHRTLGPESRDHRDTLVAECLESCVLNVAALQNHCGSLGYHSVAGTSIKEQIVSTHHSRSANLDDLTISHFHCCLAPFHVRTVGKHCDANEWEAVIVPREADVLALWTLVVTGVEEDIDIANLVVECVNEIDSRYLRNGFL